MYQTWEFFKDDAGRWRWVYNPADESQEKQSVQSFDTRSACMMDAIRNGYRNPSYSRRVRVHFVH